MAMKKESISSMFKVLIFVLLPIVALAEEGGPEFNYDNGGSDWGGFCVNDTTQSPINVFTLTTSLDVSLPVPPNTSYVTANGSLENDGFGPEVKGPFGTFTIGNQTYTFNNFHFHRPAEHTINFIRYPLEMHLVHTAGNQTAVIAVFFTLGFRSAFLDQFFNLLPQVATSHATVVVPNLTLMKPVGQYFRYIGSLTTPPCTPGVVWTVMRTPMTLSLGQLFQYLANFPEANARPTQALNGRVVTRSTFF